MVNITIWIKKMFNNKHTADGRRSRAAVSRLKRPAGPEHVAHQGVVHHRPLQKRPPR